MERARLAHLQLLGVVAMSHTAYKQERDRRHGPPPDHDYEFWEKLEQAVKDKADNQGERDGRNTED